MPLRIAGNTYNPALVILNEKGYRLKFTPAKADEGFPDWEAEKDGHLFSATNPPELLGLVAIWERFGDRWQEAIREPDILGQTMDAAELPDGER